MRAGTLREKVVIYQPPTARNAYGEVDGAWMSVASVWADIRPLVGNEALRGAVETAQTPYRVRIRYLGSVDTSMRIVRADGTVLEIRAVQHVDNRKRETVLACVAIQPEQSMMMIENPGGPL